MRRIFMFALVASGAFVLLALPSPGHETPRASACTGGIGSIEEFVPSSDLIVLGDAVTVGGPDNEGPTVTPTATPTAIATPGRGTPTIPPYPPEPTTASRGTVTFDLTGYGVTLKVVQMYVGPTGARIDLDAGARRAIERQLREPRPTSNCVPGSFVPRYELGNRYLVFARAYPEFGLAASAVFLVEGDSVVLGDERLSQANQDVLYMQLATYDRFFRGTSIDSRQFGDLVHLFSGRVPLVSVLRAVAAIRGDPSIAPPDTGSAGLASGRR